MGHTISQRYTGKRPCLTTYQLEQSVHYLWRPEDLKYIFQKLSATSAIRTPRSGHASAESDMMYESCQSAQTHTTTLAGGRQQKSKVRSRRVTRVRSLRTWACAGFSTRRDVLANNVYSETLFRRLFYSVEQEEDKPRNICKNET